MLRTSGQDRFLVGRSGIWYYLRRVPRTLVEIDTRAPIVRLSLKIDDLAKARAQRDILEKADNELWAAMLLVPASRFRDSIPAGRSDDTVEVGHFDSPEV